MAKKAVSNLINDYHLLSYDTLDSTNEEARRLAGGGASHGAVIWAKRQTAGRGRMGREWISVEGNLFTTILLNPEVDLPVAAQLSFVAALAVAETVAGIVNEPQKVACKWPNDVLFAGKKIAGILLESFATTEVHGGNRQWVAVGIGINVDSFPEHVMFPATCLRDAGVEIISAKIVLSRLVSNFIQHYDAWANTGFSTIQAAWTKRAHHLHKKLEVIVGEAQHHGTFEGIDTHGHLLLGGKGGATTAIAAGDVFFQD
jgi:BirA family biotin operon repressor/biotin-[acetyl-CoA-carboxylase] ligase